MERREFLYLSAMAWLASNPPLIRRPIPGTGENLPVVGLGTWRVFNIADQPGIAIRKNILEKMKEYGGQLIDTSPMYGRAQEVIGTINSQAASRGRFFYANKVWTSGKDAGQSQIRESFQKMNTAVIDLMQVHNLVDARTQLGTLRALREEGKIRYIGISHYLASAYPDLMHWIKTEKLDFVHFNYNISRREAEQELMPMASDRGLAILINRPFEEGQLFDTVKNKKLPPWAADWGIYSWAGFFLKFILSHPAVHFTIPATSQPLHMIENLQAATGPMPDKATRIKMIQYFESI
jgi:diketogulonate reductase-like aldo/keto reductase